MDLLWKKVISLSALAGILGIAFFGFWCPRQTLHHSSSLGPMADATLCASSASNLPGAPAPAAGCFNYHAGFFNIITASPQDWYRMILLAAGFIMLASHSLFGVHKINLLALLYRLPARWRERLKKKYGIILAYILQWLALQERASFANAIA